MAMESHYTQIMKAYKIDNERNFNSKKLFKTKKENLDNIKISWNYCTYYDESGNITKIAGKNNGIIYDNDNGKLLVPLIVSYGSSDLITEGNLVYQWNDDHFEYMGIATIEILETEKFRIQIDIVNNGKYRYTSWSKGKKMTDKPDLIIDNGIKKCWCEWGYCDCNETYDGGNDAVLGKRYIFKSGEYEYAYENGWWKGGTINELTVTQSGNEILREKIMD
jgi:hypothetical protein